MSRPKSSFLDKVLGRIHRLDPEGLQAVLQRVARERTILETLFNTIEDGILVVDEEDRILYFNEAATRLLGMPDADAEGQPVARFLPELDLESLKKADLSGTEKISRHEFEVSYPQPRFLSVYAAPLDGTDVGRSGLALIIHDATEAREKTFATIESERIQALTLLAASVAHEIGNPLHALSIHLQLMERELKKLETVSVPEPKGRGLRRLTRPSPPLGTEHLQSVDKLKQYLEVAKGEITRLDYIITEFLQAIRPVPPRLQSVSLNQVVADMLSLLQPEIDNRQILLKQSLPADLPAAPMDPSQIKQALVNLVKNAIQSMTRGGTLSLETGATSDHVWVGVSDTGGGIPQEKLNRIFEPFFTTKKRGSGLGLMIVQRIIREHGGRIEIESRVRLGTTFRIWLPLRERHPRLLSAAAQKKA